MQTTLFLLFSKGDDVFFEGAYPVAEMTSQKINWFITSAVLAVLMVAMTPALAANNLIFNSDFEGGKIPGWGCQDRKLPGAITVQPNTVMTGKYAVKLHMKRCSWIAPFCCPRSIGLGKPRAQLGSEGGRKPMKKFQYEVVAMKQITLFLLIFGHGILIVAHSIELYNHYWSAKPVVVKEDQKHNDVP